MNTRKLSNILLSCLFILHSNILFAKESLPESCEAYQHMVDGKSKVSPDYTFSDSLIWRAEKNGKLNYLYGTVHTQDMRATRIPPPVRLGIFRSQHFLMEIQLSEDSNRVFREAMFFQGGSSLQSDLNPEILDLLGQQLTHYGFSAEDTLRIKPWAAFSTIGAPKPIRSPSLDQKLMSYAQSHGLEIIGIETMQELVDSLASIGYADQLQILNDTICNRGQILADTKKLVELHMRNNLKGIIDFNAEPKPDEELFTRYLDIMVYHRNQRMFERILPYFEQGESFVAVGALHLPGNRGLLNLLSEAGFEISPM